MRLQPGRHTQSYPDERRGTEGEGAIVLAFSPHGTGEDRRWRIQSGREVRAIEILVDKAAIADVILSTVGPTMVRAYAVDAVAVGGFVWLRMPVTRVQWEISDAEAASLAGTILAVLRLQDRT